MGSRRGVKPLTGVEGPEMEMEEQDKSHREKNAIIFNLIEDNIHDKLKVGKVVNDGLNLKNIEIEEIFRIGKREINKVRPIIVKFKNVEQKWDTIKMSKLLNGKEAYRNIRIYPDLTRAERVVEKNLLDELKKKKEQGELDWTIRKGKLVRRHFLEQ